MTPSPEPFLPGVFNGRSDALGGADFDEAQLFRYRLWRRWDEAALVVFLMLNPSIADEFILDQTLKKCRSYARRWGFGGFEIVNLFAYRSTDPDILPHVADPIGPENDRWIRQVCTPDRRVIAAWGTKGTHGGRDAAVRTMLEAVGVRLHVLRLTKGGHPEHPLYLPAHLDPTPWERAA